ncbi:ankyrin repeat-containing domain protein [Aspergillus novoparasiticus]|uniref:Ankyrin repeat-containing domain protein n=1 Tax=Aspergillus novoparasiticus TaxID=986946 RepID=A0A5N6ENK3_9EURO|nr:ankyrin repeat-containing domain protein [Aspergillus novoparasiticus]
MLLDAGTKAINWRDTRTGYTPYSTPLLLAAEHGNTSVVRLFLDQPAIELDQVSYNGRLPLSYAAENGHEEIIGLLLSRGAYTETSPHPCLTPLAYASENGHARIVEKLLQTQKVNVGISRLGREHPTLDGRSREPRCGRQAASSRYSQVVRLLTETKAVDLDAKDRFYSRTPLLWAATRLGNENVIKHMIDAGAKDIECQGRWPSRTALSYACEEGNGTVVRLLLKTGLASPTYGRTSLSFASEKGHTSIVKLLLAVEPVAPDLADTTYGRTPLSWAAARAHMEVAQLLHY